MSVVCVTKDSGGKNTRTDLTNTRHQMVGLVQEGPVTLLIQSTDRCFLAPAILVLLNGSQYTLLIHQFVRFCF